MFPNIRGKQILVSLFVILMSPMAFASIWENTNKWDQQWEKQFNEWVEFQYSEDIFMTGKYKGIPTDCADAVYAARAVFAYENGLPFVIKDHSGGSRLITNSMSRYNKIANPMKRFKRFMLYIFDMTNTKTLPHDTYQVQINRDWVKSGGVWSRPRRNASQLFGTVGSEVQPGHADLIKKVADTGVIYLIGSTVPQAKRNLKTTSSLVFLPNNSQSGIRYWLNPTQYFIKNQNKLPGFSNEQFEMGKKGKKRKLGRWKKEVTNRLKTRDESHEEMLQRYVDNVCAMMKERVEVVARSEKKRSYIHGVKKRCMNEKEYDLYSTPSRDGKLQKAIKSLVRVKYKNGFITKRRMRSFAPYFESCGEMKVNKETTMSFSKAMIKLYKGKMSTNPNQSVKARWGLEKEGRNDCKVWY
jgi:hypothetical protein